MVVGLAPQDCPGPVQLLHEHDMRDLGARPGSREHTGVHERQRSRTCCAGRVGDDMQCWQSAWLSMLPPF